jgi:hypothetical protein
MSNVFNKTNNIYLVSVNTPDYPEETWLINPDLSQVAGVPQKYWKYDSQSNSIIEMTSEEKAIIDG